MAKGIFVKKGTTKGKVLRGIFVPKGTARRSAAPYKPYIRTKKLKFLV